MKKTIFCLIGPSGSGKSKIANTLSELGIPEIISHTTRPKREGEIDGVNYYFVSDSEFDNLEKLEFANYGKYKYCISKKELDSKFKNYDKLIAVVEMGGFKQIKNNYSDKANIISIFIKTDLETMKERMLIRNDKLEDIEYRIQNAIDSKEFDNEFLTDFVVDNRGDFDTTMSKIREIIEV